MNWTGIYSVDLANVLSAMRKRGETQLANQFQAFAAQMHASNPNASVQSILQTFLGTELAGGIGTAIGQTGTELGQIPGAAAQGATKAIETLGGFNLSSWFLRIGEILLGLVLIGVGIARLTGAQNAISKAVKTVI